MFHLTYRLGVVQCPIVTGAIRFISELWQTQAYIGGIWHAGKSGDKYEVLNPANGEAIGSVPNMTESDAQMAIDAANKSFYAPSWAHITAKQRSDLLKNWHALIAESSKTLASIITAESGKPMAESHAEVAYGNSFVDWYAEETRRINGEIIASPVANEELLIVRQPLGVAALISSWNFPVAMVLRKASAALASGCTVIIKPAINTPLSSLALAKLAEFAGLPPGVLNVVTTKRSEEIGKLFCKSPLVRCISFTGSTLVGKILYRQGAEHMKRVTLELGGNAPFIVFESADIESAVEGALVSKFRNTGQTCIASNRFYVQASIFDAFTAKLVKRVEALKVGPGNCEGVQIGPLINSAQLKRIEELVEEASNHGAELLTGGYQLSELGALFYAPTVLTNLGGKERIYREEVFGPIISLLKFETEEEVLSKANKTESGLAGYFYSRDLQQVFRVAKHLQVGIVGINTGLVGRAEAPFGGVKNSGIGREGSHHGINEFVDMKYICLSGLRYH